MKKNPTLCEHFYTYVFYIHFSDNQTNEYNQPNFDELMLSVAKSSKKVGRYLGIKGVRLNASKLSINLLIMLD